VEPSTTSRGSFGLGIKMVDASILKPPRLAISALLAGALLCGASVCAAPPSVNAGERAPTSAAAAPGVKRALLVGINNYKAVPHLMGSLNDVAAMKQILTTRWGFSPDNIVILTEQAATRAAILRELRRLVRESGPNDTVVFHYSGHGSQVKDLNGDEDDGLDETLVPYDGRTAGVPDIVDDELDVIFSKLRTSAALIILDSCHSGTGTRSVDFRPRGIPQDTRLEEYQDPAVRPSSGVATRAIVPRVESRQLVMSAVAADQEALDGPVDGDYHGIFTYALSKTLAASPDSASARDIFAGVAQEIGRLQVKFGNTAMPEPQLEGPPTAIDGPLLAWAHTDAAAQMPAPRLAWLETQPGVAGEVILTNGVLLGAAPGSTWAIYPPAETAFAPGRALAVATVVANSGLDARASLQPATVQIAAASRAVALMPSANDKTTVRILDVPPALRTQIEAVLVHTIANVEIVGAGRAARFLIDVHAGMLRLLSADGGSTLGIYDTQTDQWGPAVARVIARSTDASQLLALDNPVSQLRVQAQVVGTDSGSARDIIVVAKSRPAQLHIRRANEVRSPQNSLQLAVNVSADAYLTIVDVDSEGNTNLLFPNSYQRTGFSSAGHVLGNQQLLIPDSLASGSRAGFFWDYGPPAGIDTIRVFASTDLRTAQLIRERIRALGASSGTRGVPSASAASGYEGLRHELTGLATRGIVTQQDPSPASDAAGSQTSASAPDWAATSVTVSVTE